MAENRSLKSGLKDNKKLVIAGFALFVIAMAVSVIGIANTQPWSGDFSQYLSQTRAIADGQVNEWFMKHSYTIDHSASGLGAHSYPWLTSILIIPIYMIWGTNFVPYQVFMAFCLAVTVIALYILLLRRNVKLSAALLICGALILNIHYAGYTKIILSDIPCLMFTVIAWVLIDRYLEVRNIKYGILVGVLSFAAFSTRTMALALLAGLGLVDLIHFIKQIKGRKMTVKAFGVMCVPYVSFLVPTAILSVALPKGGSTYLDYFSVTAGQLKSNITYYANMLLSMFTQNIQNCSFWPQAIKDHKMVIPALLVVIMIPFISAALIGAFKRIKEADHLPFYLIVMLLMLFVYDYQQGTRFIFSLFPIVLILAYYGMNSAKIMIAEKKSGKKASGMENLQKIARVDFAAVLILCMIFGTIRIARGDTASTKAIESVNSQYALEVYDYINENLDTDDVVIFYRPRILRLYTDVYSYTNDTELPETIGDADYILNYAGDSRYVDYIVKNKNSLEQVFSNGYFKLYKIDKENLGGSNNG